jgi:Lysozyme like domain
VTVAQVGAEPFAVHHKLWIPGPVRSIGPAPGTGALLGKQWEPRALARLIYEEGWNDAFELLTSLQVCLAESQGYDHAIHVNLNGTQDRGVWQLNSIHAEITDEIAYDPVQATVYAFRLFAARKGWEDWAAYTTGVFLHDSYVGRAARGMANYLGEETLAIPVPDWADKPYVHKFKTPMLAFQHQVAGADEHLSAARTTLGFQAAPKAKVDATQLEIAAAKTALKAPLPPAPVSP